MADVIDLNEYRDQVEFSQELESLEERASRVRAFLSLSEQQKRMALRSSRGEFLLENLGQIIEDVSLAYSNTREFLERF